MTDDEVIEAMDATVIDAAEIAALERAADGASPYPRPTSRAGSIPARLARPENPVGSGEREVAPPGAVMEHDPVHVWPVDGEAVAPAGGVAPRRMVSRAAVEAAYPRPPKPGLLMVAPDGTITPLVEAGDVMARLARLEALEARLVQIEKIAQHTHMLTIALADLFRIAPEEVDAITRAMLGPATRPET
jgi:hypothetical protein